MAVDLASVERLADAVASMLASASVSRGFDGSLLVQGHRQGILHPYSGGSD